MGTHHHRHATQPMWRSWRSALVLIIPAGLVTLIAMILLWPPDASGPEQTGIPGRTFGVIKVMDSEPCPDQIGANNSGCGTALVQITSGADKGEDITVDLSGRTASAKFAEGDEVVLTHQAEPGDGLYAIVDHQRHNQLWMLGAAFVLAVIAFGRWRGLTALAGLAVTFVVLLLFVVPAILAGKPPLLVAIVGSAAIMLTVLYLTHGFTRSTSVAVVGTLTSLTLTGLLSAAAVAATHLSGVADEQSAYLGITHNVNMQGLLLAGILIGSLGVLDDVTVTQAATVTELAHANPTYRFMQLYRAATRVGRAHIASVINTIILAYAGASLPLLVLIDANNRAIGEVLTNQLIAQELVRSAVGTLGLIAAVPITTALAAYTASRTGNVAAATERRPGTQWVEDWQHAAAEAHETADLSRQHRDRNSEW
jgi:uncharacterized membrane protein